MEATGRNAGPASKHCSRVKLFGQPFDNLFSRLFATELSQFLLAAFIKVRAMPKLHGWVLSDVESIAQLDLHQHLQEYGGKRISL